MWCIVSAHLFHTHCQAINLVRIIYTFNNGIVPTWGCTIIIYYKNKATDYSGQLLMISIEYIPPAVTVY